MSIYVLDAGAMIAYARREPGWNALPEALADSGSAERADLLALEGAV